MTNRGGKRPGAGRKPGSNAYGESTVTMRVPESQKPVIRVFLEALARRRQPQGIGNTSGVMHYDPDNSGLALPLYTSKVAAGFPSPADDHLEQRLRPGDYLVSNESATFFVRVKGDSMIDAGIFDNDVLVVDRSLTAQLGNIVLAMVDGEFTVKILGRSNACPQLIPANKAYPVIEIMENHSFEVFGVITGSMRKFL